MFPLMFRITMRSLSAVKDCDNRLILESSYISDNICVTCSLSVLCSFVPNVLNGYRYVLFNIKIYHT